MQREKPRPCTKIGTSKLGFGMPMNRQLDAAGLIALVCIFWSWFFVDTFTVTLGSLQHGVRFYDVPALIADPTRMFFGTAATFRTFLFGAVCIGCLLLPLGVYWRGERWIWFAFCAPLTLMLVCGLLLYSRTAGEFFATPTNAAGVSGNLIHFANGLVHRGSDAVARHVNIGVGGYAAFAASLVLTISGVRGFKRQAVSAA
jgi:hypothetical protein